LECKIESTFLKINLEMSHEIAPNLDIGYKLEFVRGLTN
jgi:hypothetical protein